MSQPQSIVSVTSPVPGPVGPPSMAAPQPAARNSNTIILVIVIIAIVVFVVFLFTKLNTMNKELKELKAEREETAKWMKLVKAMAGQLGVQQDEKGEIQFVEKDDDEEDNGDADDEKECAQDPQIVQEPDMVLRQPGCLFNLFGGARVDGNPTVRGARSCDAGIPLAVFQQMQAQAQAQMPKIDEENEPVDEAQAEQATPAAAPNVAQAAQAPKAAQAPTAVAAAGVGVD